MILISPYAQKLLNSRENPKNATPLIQGDFASGYVGINKETPTEALDVIGNEKLLSSNHTGLTSNTIVWQFPATGRNNII